MIGSSPRQTEGEKEGEMGREIEFVSRCALALIKPLRSRVYIRLGSGAKRGSETRGQGSGEEDFIFGSPMTFTSSRKRRGARPGAKEEKMKTTAQKKKREKNLRRRRRMMKKKKKKKRATPNTI